MQISLFRQIFFQKFFSCNVMVLLLLFSFVISFCFVFSLVMVGLCKRIRMMEVCKLVLLLNVVKSFTLHLKVKLFALIRDTVRGRLWIAVHCIFKSSYPDLNRNPLVLNLRFIEKYYICIGTFVAFLANVI